MSLTDKKASDTFLKGFESALDLFPKIDSIPFQSLNNEVFLDSKACKFDVNSFNAFKLDVDSFNNDWNKIGLDFENAIRKYENSSKESIND